MFSFERTAPAKGGAEARESGMPTEEHFGIAAHIMNGP